MATVQEYQAALQKHRNAELNIAKAKAQAELYQKDIQAILASENVSTIEELTGLYKQEQENLTIITNLLNKETEAANAVLSKLGMAQ